jgi:hypothetical protein
MAEVLEREYGIAPAAVTDVPAPPRAAPESSPQVSPPASTTPDVRV